MIITGTSVQTLSAEILSLSVKASVRPSSSDHGDMLCGTEPYHANMGMMIPGSFHRQDTFRHAMMSTRTSVRFSLTHAAWFASRNHAAHVQANDYRPSCQVTLRYKTKCYLSWWFECTTQPHSAHRTFIMTRKSSQTTERENYHHVIPSFWESAPRTHHGGVMFSTRPRNATTRRTTAKLHNQDHWTKCQHVKQIFGGNVLQVWRPMVCIARPHSANIAMIVAGTSSQTRKLHVNQTRVQLSSKNPGGVVCVHHGSAPCHM